LFDKDAAVDEGTSHSFRKLSTEFSLDTLQQNVSETLSLQRNSFGSRNRNLGWIIALTI